MAKTSAYFTVSGISGKHDVKDIKRGPYFEGWYLKHQTREGAALALIPAYHTDGEGRHSASLQVLAEGRAWWLAYPDAAFRASEQVFRVQMGQSLFTEQETRLCVEREGLPLDPVRLAGGLP